MKDTLLFWVSTALMALALVWVVASAASAQTNCGPPDLVKARLGEQFGERVQVQGLTASGHLMQWYASAGGSWTIVLTTPAGPSCMMAAGQDFQIVAEALGRDG